MLREDTDAAPVQLALHGTVERIRKSKRTFGAITYDMHLSRGCEPGNDTSEKQPLQALLKATHFAEESSRTEQFTRNMTARVYIDKTAVSYTHLTLPTKA